MRVVHWNVNGLRAASGKGLLDWLATTSAHVVCFQEVRATPAQYDTGPLEALGWHVTWCPAQRLGYSGVATLSRQRPRTVERGLGEDRFDDEGRVLITRHRGLTVVNAYFPNAQRELTRLDYKADFYRALLRRCEALRAAGECVVVGGDWNTAHRPIDLKNWRANQDQNGFTPAERALMDEWVAAGWTDAWRHQQPATTDRYTWWSNRPGVREKNVGWRIDLQMVPTEQIHRVRRVWIHDQVQGSDHCPVELDVV